MLSEALSGVRRSKPFMSYDIQMQLHLILYFKDKRQKMWKSMSLSQNGVSHKVDLQGCDSYRASAKYHRHSFVI